MSDIKIEWKKITRGLPKIRRHADDRAPTIEKIQKICEYPDRRIKGIVYTMASSGIRLGAWDYIRWKDIQPIEHQGKIVAAKIIVYAGDDEAYFSFIIPEAYFDLEKEIQRLVENNMKTIFSLDFVTSEFELHGLRVDSLGFDRESKSFTIIEYKREKNFSVIDQGYAYLSLLLNNKAEFILKFNENTKDGFLKI